MATIEDIKARANLVKNETQVGGNTADRVGGVLVDLAEHTEVLEDEQLVTPSIVNTHLGDLEFADENNFVIARFKNGHVKTKYFDSENPIEILNNQIIIH